RTASAPGDYHCGWAGIKPSAHLVYNAGGLFIPRQAAPVVQGPAGKACACNTGIMMKMRKLSLTRVLVVALAGCAVGPDYSVPTVDVGQQFENQEGWVRAQPDAATLLRSDWWVLFDDSVLNGLMDEVLVNNQSIAQ